MVCDTNDRAIVAGRLISEGDAAGALVVAHALLQEPDGSRPVARMSCAGLLIDAGERLDDENAVREGIAILERLRSDTTLPEQYARDLLYNLANGKSSLIHMAHRRRTEPDESVRDFRDEEEVVAIYYDASDALRDAKPEVVINCASMLRVEGRVYEAIDLLDHVPRRHPDHPNAHMKMAEMLWAAFTAVRGHDNMREALLVPALVHYARASAGFDAVEEPMFAASCRDNAARLRQLANKVLAGQADAAVADVGDRVLGSGLRFGAPLGLGMLARSPYRDEDDLWLTEELRADLRDIVVDAAGTLATGRAFLTDLAAPPITMPRWGEHTPNAALHLRHAAVWQLWSVMEKVAWLTNTAFDVQLPERDCSFAKLFEPPPKGGGRFRPNLDRQNPGVRALSGLSAAFDAKTGVYAPLKRLRNSVEHRGPEQAATQDDAAFLLGIARAALLHAVDAIVFESATAPSS